MSTHCGFIVKVEKICPHPNANKLQLVTFFGETVVVDLEIKIGDIGIYFPCDLQLSEEYCDKNDLCRKRADGSEGKGYLEREKRNVKAIKLRNEKSFGLFMPLSSIAYTGINLDDLNVGDPITVLNGHEICCKYIPKRTSKSGHVKSGNKVRKKKAPVAPLFAEHADTEQLAYNLSAFKPGDEIEITLKMHGTSQRTAYLPVFKGYKRTLWDKICRKEGTPIYDWGYVSGTRRTVLENYDGGYYGSNEFREQHSKTFEGKLWKGEEIFYEVVGFTHTGTPIMATADNKKLNDKEFVKQYGKTTTFSYGCDVAPTGITEDGQVVKLPPESDIYVYRMTMINEDSDVVEYTPDFMRYRCEQMGVKTVPVMWRDRIPEYPGSADDDTITAGEWIKNVAEQFYDGPDPIGKTHIREGVVVRILNRPKFCAYKHKNFSFKVLENIIKDVADVPDMEEAEELIREAEAKNAE